MAGYLRRNRVWNPRGRGGTWGLLERVTGPAFCEMRGCAKLASWKIGTDSVGVEFCTRHTLSTMRNARIWSASG